MQKIPLLHLFCIHKVHFFINFMSVGPLKTYIGMCLLTALVALPDRSCTAELLQAHKWSLGGKKIKWNLVRIDVYLHSPEVVAVLFMA